MLAAIGWGIEGFSNLNAFIIYLNALGAASAVVGTIWACTKLPSVMIKVIMPITTLAVFYVFSYVLLIFDIVSFDNWSQFMRGASVLVWPIVWVWPWVHIARLHKKLLQRKEYISEILRIKLESLEDGEI